MNTSAIAERAHRVQPGQSQGADLRVLPILGSSHDQPPYRVLDSETLPFVRVTEVSAAGSVPELLVDNKLDVAVFLMDGQELIGAKQNRILNTDVMVPAATSLKIPVSCVERGRWHRLSDCFVTGKSASHRTRVAKQERVKASLRERGRHDAVQSAVWDEVDMSLADAGAVSPTSALSAAYANRRAELSRFRESLQLPDDAVGVAVFHGTTFQGLDLFDRHSTLRYFWESLVDSYALEWLGIPATQTDGAADDDRQRSAVREALDRATAAAWESFSSPGQGTDWRLEDPQLSGSALVCDPQSVIHLQLIPKNPDTGASWPRRRPAIRRPYGPARDDRIE